MEQSRLFIKNGRCLEEINLNKDNWFYIQIDATIRTAFMTNEIPLPKFVIFEELSNRTVIYIFRDDVDTIEQTADWLEKQVYITDDLMRAAECNSTEERDYKFVLI